MILSRLWHLYCLTIHEAVRHLNRLPEPLCSLVTSLFLVLQIIRPNLMMFLSLLLFPLWTLNEILHCLLPNNKRNTSRTQQLHRLLDRFFLHVRRHLVHHHMQNRQLFRFTRQESLLLLHYVTMLLLSEVAYQHLPLRLLFLLSRVANHLYLTHLLFSHQVPPPTPLRR